MITPDRDTARLITLHIEGLLANSHALPRGFAAALRAYRTELMQACAYQPWARPGHRARYGKLADTIARHITDGNYKPGQRMPSSPLLAKTYYEKKQTVHRALFILAIRGQLSQELLTYHVLPDMQLRPKNPDVSLFSENISRPQSFA